MPWRGKRSLHMRPWITRKCLFSLLPRCSVGTNFWADMTVSELKGMVPDVTEQLPELPADSAVRHVTSIFGLSPRVGPLMISLAACFCNRAHAELPFVAKLLRTSHSVLLLGEVFEELREGVVPTLSQALKHIAGTPCCEPVCQTAPSRKGRPGCGQSSQL
jgi:hypothetical protein